MEHSLGEALSGFERALTRFRKSLEPMPELCLAVFEDTQEWSDLLTYKLVPHLAGEGCLIAAVSGGTNTGKSCIFNLLLGRLVSPIVNTAAATCHPILAANAARREACLAAQLVPEFDPRPFDRPEDATDPSLPSDTLLIAAAQDLPDHLILMDTPDIDSIDRANWDIAEHIRATGDVLVAVLTGEKYKDQKVVAFFREALAAGRVIVPVMNKANPEKDFDVARRQLDEFRADVELEGPCFVVAHDFDLAENPTRPIDALDGGPDLRSYIESLPVQSIKERVFSGTVRRFSERATEFITHAEQIGAGLTEVVVRFEAEARAAAQTYDPAPGEQIGGLFHEFVQSRRGPVRRYIGTASSTAVRGISLIGRRVAAAFRNRATLEPEDAPDPAELNEMHRKAVERIAQNLAAQYIELARNLHGPGAALVREALTEVDVDAAVRAIADDMTQAEDISEEFREHAQRLLESWWDEHPGRRRALEALDTMLAIVPMAIAAPIAMHTGGVGASEAVVVVAPVAEQFVARVIEYQFGDAMFDFLSPWKREQQEALEQSLHTHLTAPGLRILRDALKSFDGDALAELKGHLDTCRSH